MFTRTLVRSAQVSNTVQSKTLDCITNLSNIASKTKRSHRTISHSTTTSTRHITTSSTPHTRTTTHSLDLHTTTRRDLSQTINSLIRSTSKQPKQFTKTISTCPKGIKNTPKQLPTTTTHQPKRFLSSQINGAIGQQQQQFVNPPPEPTIRELVKALFKKFTKNPFKRAPKAPPQLPKSQEELDLFLYNHRRRKWIKRGLILLIVSPVILLFGFGLRASGFVSAVNDFGGFEKFAREEGLMDLYALPLQLDKPLVGAITAYHGEPLVEESFQDLQKVLLRCALIERELIGVIEESLKGLEYYLMFNKTIQNDVLGDQMKVRDEIRLLISDLKDRRQALHASSATILLLFGTPKSIIDGVNIQRLTWFKRRVYPTLMTRSYEMIDGTKLVLKQAVVLGAYLNSMQSASWRSTVPLEYQSLFGYQQFLYFAGRAVAKRQAAALHQMHVERELKLEEEFEEKKRARQNDPNSANIDVDPQDEYYTPHQQPIMIQPDFVNGPDGGLNWRPLFSGLLKADEENRIKRAAMKSHQRRVDGLDSNTDNDESDQYDVNEDEQDNVLYLSSMPFYAPMLSEDEKENLTLLPNDVVIDPTQLPFDKFNFNYLPPTESDFKNALHYRRYTDYPEFLWRYTPMVRLPGVRLNEFVERITNNQYNHQYSRRSQQDKLTNSQFTSPTLSIQALSRLPRPDPIKYNPHNDAATLNEPHLIINIPSSREFMKNDLVAMKTLNWTLRYGYVGGSDRPRIGTFLQIPFKGQMIDGNVQLKDIEERAGVKGKLTGIDNQHDFIVNYTNYKTQ